jgi:integrase/recombinase XerC
VYTALAVSDRMFVIIVVFANKPGKGEAVQAVAELVTARQLGIVRDESIEAERLVRMFLEGRNGTTLRAYAGDLEDFSGFLGAEDVNSGAKLLLSAGPGEANALALSYRTDMIKRSLTPSTVNRRLAALRSLVTLARVLGMVVWRLEVSNLKSVPYRDTSGPGQAGVGRMMAIAREDGNPQKARRDYCVIRMLYDLGLRRGELVALDLDDIDAEKRTVAICGKGRSEKERLTVPLQTLEALQNWLEVRGDEPGPLFTNFDRAGKGYRLTGAGVYAIVQSIGRKAGLRAVRPHGLRHCAVTTALDVTGGNVRAVQRFSRHRNLETLMVYDDNRRDMAGEVAALVAAGVSG